MLLQAPGSTPPRPPTRRRKTLAGVTSFPGFPATRSSPRLQAKKRTMPIAKVAEQLLCQRLGIVDEGDSATEEAIARFVQLFDGNLPALTISALRALFKLDCDLTTAVEEALIEHGGAPEIEQVEDLASA